MKDRIRQLMEDQHLTQQTFAQMIGSSTATLSNIFNGKTNPSLSIVDGIHKSFPQVNVYWVLYGTPPMYQSQGGQSAQDGTSSVAAPLSAGEQDGVMDRVLAESEGGGMCPAILRLRREREQDWGRVLHQSLLHSSDSRRCMEPTQLRQKISPRRQ